MCDFPSERKLKLLHDKLFKDAKQCYPTSIIMVGGPGSGKSVARVQCIKALKYNIKDFVVIDPDEIYTLFKTNECRNIINHINDIYFQHAYNNHYHLVFDGTGKNFNWTYKEVIQKLKKESYRIIVCISLLNVKEALQRIKKREKLTQRKVPENFTKDVYKQLTKVIPKYLKLKEKDVDIILVFDNTKKLTLILEVDWFENEKGKMEKHVTCPSSLKNQQSLKKEIEKLC